MGCVAKIETCVAKTGMCMAKIEGRVAKISNCIALFYRALSSIPTLQVVLNDLWVKNDIADEAWT